MTHPTAKGCTAVIVGTCNKIVQPHENIASCETWVKLPARVALQTDLEPIQASYVTGSQTYTPEMKAAPESEDEASPLPVEEKFTLYLDGDGDYIIQANREEQWEFIAAHGSTPDEAVYAMRQILDLCARARLDANGGKS